MCFFVSSVDVDDIEIEILMSFSKLSDLRINLVELV